MDNSYTPESYSNNRIRSWKYTKAWNYMHTDAEKYKNSDFSSFSFICFLYVHKHANIWLLTEQPKLPLLTYHSLTSIPWSHYAPRILTLNCIPHFYTSHNNIIKKGEVSMNCSSMKNLQNWTFLSSIIYTVFNNILLHNGFLQLITYPLEQWVNQSGCAITNSTEHNTLLGRAIH